MLPLLIGIDGEIRGGLHEIVRYRFEKYAFPEEFLDESAKYGL